MSVGTLTKRGYELDGAVLPRVSSILATLARPSLLAWERKVGLAEAERVRQASAAKGTAIHAALEHVHQGVVWEPATDADAWLAPIVAAYVGWFRAHVAAVLGAERIVWSTQHGYAGTLDALLRLRDGRVCLMDIKSGRSVDANARLQTAAYVGALAERDGTAVDARLVLHVPASAPGTLRVVEFDDYPRDWLTFRCLVAAYYWQRDHSNDWRDA